MKPELKREKFKISGTSKLQNFKFSNKKSYLIELEVLISEATNWGISIQGVGVNSNEKIDIGLEIDRNTKVKEKDLPASQAMCGQEKYKKDFEF